MGKKVKKRMRLSINYAEKDLITYSHLTQNEGCSFFTEVQLMIKHFRINNYKIIQLEFYVNITITNRYKIGTLEPHTIYHNFVARLF